VGAEVVVAGAAAVVNEFVIVTSAVVVGAIVVTDVVVGAVVVGSMGIGVGVYKLG
jgi:hypothetical protein